MALTVVELVLIFRRIYHDFKESKPGKVDILEQIKEEVKKLDKGTYQKWAQEDFDVDYLFGQNERLLQTAALVGELDIVKYLVEKGADLDATDIILVQTALHGAANNGDLDIVKYLVEKGADLDPKNRLGNTPLHLAAEKGRLDIVKYLVEKGADLDATDMLGNAALHLAAGKGLSDIVKYLIEKGADLDLADRFSFPGTILYPAILYRHLNVAEQIVNHTTKLGTVGLYVSAMHLNKRGVFIRSSKERKDNHSQHSQNCKKEVKKIKEINGPLHDFLIKNNIDNLVDIWEQNENLRNEFDNEENLKKLYPEYAHILIDKANKAKKEIFLHNHKPLIDVLSENYKRDFKAMKFNSVKRFFEIRKDYIIVEIAAITKSLIEFVDFKDLRKREAPRLELYAFAQSIKNEGVGDKPPIEFVDFKDLRKREAPRLELYAFVQSIKNEGVGGKPPNGRKESQWPFAAAAIIILGVAVAVYLEMLSVIIAIGVCLLVALGVMCHFTKPIAPLGPLGGDGTNFKVEDFQQFTGSMSEKVVAGSF